MYKFPPLHLLLIVSVSLSLNFSIYSQTITDPETEYSRIRFLAFDGNLIEAEKAAVELLDSFPEYGDAWILLARIYGWQQKYDPAISILDSLIENEPYNTDALEARLDLALWTGDNAYAIEIADRILASDSTNKEILEKKGRAIAAQEPVDTSGMAILHPEDSLESIQPGIIKTKQIEHASKTDLRAGYYFDTFKEPYSRYWQVFQAGASRLFPFGRVLAGVNVGNLHAGTDPVTRATEFQFEAEAYPKISQYDYAWLSYAFSPGKYFPAHRISAEYWHTLKQTWVVSAGFNYYYFHRNIFIASLSGEKYYKSYWFSSKVYFYFKDKGITTSLFINARKYFNDVNYLQLTAGFGTAPDEPFDIEIDLERMRAATFKLAYFRSITDDLFIRIGTGYSREQYAASLWRNRFDGGISLIYILKNKE
jgi:YaiO family outer membrane protein